MSPILQIFKNLKIDFKPKSNYISHLENTGIPMVLNLIQLTGYLDEFLKITDIEDTSLNGLQVEGKKRITRAAFAVDASLESFEKTRKVNAEILITHHGLLWGQMERITGAFYKRIKFLIGSEISLYSVHLPLDIHEEVGNNIQLAKILNLIDISPFGDYHGINIGYKGKLPKEKDFEDVANFIEKKLNCSTTKFKFKNKPVKTIGIVSGGAGKIINEAANSEIDLYLTGETYHSGYHTAKEAGLNLIFAGHYATEVLGLKALSEHLKDKFNIETTFIDIPTKM